MARRPEAAPTVPSAAIAEHPDGVQYRSERTRKVKLATLRVLAKVELLRRRLRRDPDLFIEFAFRDKKGRPLQQAWFHREWQAAWTAHKANVTVAPRDHGKTTQTIGRVIWELGNNPNLRVKIVCQSDNKSKERLYEVTLHIEANRRVHFVFPALRSANRGEWSKHKIYIARELIGKDASVEAVGVLSTATGGRADLLFFDDVCDRRNSLQFPKLRENVKNSYRDDWINLLEPDGRSIYIGTKWHKNDLTHELIAEKNAHVLEYSVPEDLTPIWPEVWTKAALEQRLREIGRVAFNRGFRNIALSGDVAFIQSEWIRYVRLDQMPDDMLVFCAYDLAISKNERADFFARVVLGFSRTTRRIYVIAASHKRGVTVHGQAKILESDWSRWQARRMIVETVAFQEALAQHVAATTLLPVYGYKPTTNKGQRLEAVQPYIETGKVLFASHLNPEAGKVSQETGDLITELTEFPLFATDDLVDAFTEGVLAIVDLYAAELREGRDPDGDPLWDDEPEAAETNVYAI